MDNFYNSVELSEELLGVKMHTVVKLHLHQRDPADIRNTNIGKSKIKAGNSLSVDNGKVMVVGWKDKRVVTALSTKHNGRLGIITQKRRLQ